MTTTTTLSLPDGRIIRCAVRAAHGRRIIGVTLDGAPVLAVTLMMRDGRVTGVTIHGGSVLGTETEADIIEALIAHYEAS